MSRTAKTTLAFSTILSCTIIWGVHFMQQRESDTMYQGVLRDEERRREKMQQREEELKVSLEKRAIYERVQSVTRKAESDSAT